MLFVGRVAMVGLLLLAAQWGAHWYTAKPLVLSESKSALDEHSLRRCDAQLAVALCFEHANVDRLEWLSLYFARFSDVCVVGYTSNPAAYEAASAMGVPLVLLPRPAEQGRRPRRDESAATTIVGLLRHFVEGGTARRGVFNPNTHLVYWDIQLEPSKDALAVLQWASAQVKNSVAVGASLAHWKAYEGDLHGHGWPSFAFGLLYSPRFLDEYLNASGHEVPAWLHYRKWQGAENCACLSSSAWSSAGMLVTRTQAEVWADIIEPRQGDWETQISNYMALSDHLWLLPCWFRAAQRGALELSDNGELMAKLSKSVALPVALLSSLPPLRCRRAPPLRQNLINCLIHALRAHSVA